MNKELDLAILFYSENSPMCRDLFSHIGNYDLRSIEYICVDSENIKKQLLNGEDLKIEYVPTLLLINTDKSIEKHESDNVFDWFNMIIQSHHELQNQNIPEKHNKKHKKSQKGYEYTPEPIEEDLSAIRHPVHREDPFPPGSISEGEDESEDESEDDDPFDGEITTSKEEYTPDTNNGRGDGTGGNQSKDAPNQIMDMASKMASAREREIESDEQNLRSPKKSKKKRH